METPNFNSSTYNSIYDKISTEGTFLKTLQWDKDITISNLCPLKIGGHNIIIGKGTFGEVYLSKHNETDIVYAIKHMEKQLLLKTMHTLEIIRKEIEIHGKLLHKNITRLYNVYENTTDYYLIMEHSDNGNLFSLLKQNGPLTESNARTYFIQVVSAIHFLHRNNIIHRDIKPENILLNNNNEIKLCDFGWANYVDITRNTFCGTLEYMSPEILGNEEYNKEIDIWALGVLLYELIHGYSPFIRKGNDNGKVITEYKEMLDNIRDKGIFFKNEISDTCKDLIKEMLEVDGTKRIKIDDIAKHPFIGGNVLCRKNCLKDISCEFDKISNEGEEKKELPMFTKAKALSHKNVLSGIRAFAKKDKKGEKESVCDCKKFSAMLFGDDIDVLDEDINEFCNDNENDSKGGRIHKMNSPVMKNKKHKMVLRFNMVTTEHRKHISAATLPTMGNASKFKELSKFNKKVEDEQRSTGCSSKNSQCNKEDVFNYK